MHGDVWRCSQGGFERVKLVYHNHKVINLILFFGKHSLCLTSFVCVPLQVCMAPYLFFLGVGNWVTYRRQVLPVSPLISWCRIGQLDPRSGAELDLDLD